jgi:Spx/MgsR family transcriptional regulator
MAVTLYGIPNCDTVRRARGWLADHGVAVQFHDFRKSGVPQAGLDRWLAEVGWQRLLNRQGTTWRRLDDTRRAGVTDVASAATLMREQPGLIKRPVVEWPDGTVTVGFDAARWSALAGCGASPTRPPSRD